MSERFDKKISKHLNNLELAKVFAGYYVQTNDAYKAARLAGVAERDLDKMVLAWQDNPKVLAMIEYERLVARKDETVEVGWIIGEIKAVYERAKDAHDTVNCLKALDMLGKHAGIYEKHNEGKQGVTVVVRDFSGSTKYLKDVSED